MKETNIFEHVFGAIRINFDQSNEKKLLIMYNNLTDVQHKSATQLANHIGHASNHADDKEHIYDEIACKFLRDLSETAEVKAQIQMVNLRIAKKPKPKQKVFIGGIYPKREEQENEHNG